jgi:hypothetical protein
MYEIYIITLCSLPCFASALAIYGLAHHGQAIKKLARGTTPSISQSAELISLHKRMSNHFATFELCSTFSFVWIAVAFLLLFFCSNQLSLKTSLVLYGCFVVVGIVQSLAKQREKATVHKIIKSHPCFTRMELLTQLQALQKRQKTLEGTLEKPTLTLKLDNIPAAAQHTLAEENMLKRAHQEALNDCTLAVDEPMLVIFKSKEQTLKIFLDKAELVWQPTIDEAGNTIAGRVYCAGVNFSGAKIAHFDRLAWPETQVNAFTHGWIATRERAHILLSTLWWLTDDQRIVIYELINPGQPFPIDWLPTAASRGSWQ